MNENHASRLDRLDSLPFTAKHRRLFFGSGVGWALDAMDVGMISFVIAQLATVWNLSSTHTGWIASAGFVGMAIGASLGGLLADRIGRRQVFALTLLVFGIATGASALAWSVGALIVMRFIVGLGLGAELPIASTMMSEFSPPKIRGRVIVFLEAFWAIGWLAAALIGYLVIPMSDDGWRWAFLIGAIPALYAAVVRFGLPESVRFLEQRGRYREAETIVRSFEASAGKPSPSPDQQPTDDGRAAVFQRIRLGDLFSEKLAVQTGALWVIWFLVNFAYYGAFVWLPTLLIAQGIDLVRSFEYTLIITLAQLPGYVTSAFLVEKWGRGRTLTVFLLGSAVSAALFSQAQDVWFILLAGSLLSFFNLGAWGALYAVTPELYPTRLRATGSGWAAGVGRCASIVSPLLVPIIREHNGTVWLFVIFAITFLIAAGIALLLADKRGHSLDE